MGQMFKNFLLGCLLCFIALPSFSAIQGGIDYKIPIDYTKLNKEELESKAEQYYSSAVNSKKINEDMTSALVLYNILTKKEPQNITYAVKLGKLYDVIHKDRYAKGQYFHATGINQTHPEPYYYIGCYYYDRESYRKALKFFQKAYDNGYNEHYETLYYIGNIYKKLGDTQNSLHYLQAASSIKSSSELDKQIYQVQNDNNSNKEFYRK